MIYRLDFQRHKYITLYMLCIKLLKGETMEYKYFKNGNIHVRYDSDTDGYNNEPTYSAALCIIYNSMLDCLDYDYIDSYCTVLPIINHANDETYDYYFTPYTFDVELFFSGKWIVLRPDNKHAFITVPRYFHTYDIELHGHKYMLYALEKMPNHDFMREMERYGVVWRIVSPQYAPEIKRSAMLVPYGASVHYE